MLQAASLSILQLLDSKTLPDEEVRHLIGWQALVLVDLLQRRLITVRYAEQMLFNVDVVQRLERRRLKDCVEVIDWGMQLEDWEAHTPKQLTEALSTIAPLARAYWRQGVRGGAKKIGKSGVLTSHRLAAAKQAENLSCSS